MTSVIDNFEARHPDFDMKGRIGDLVLYVDHGDIFLVLHAETSHQMLVCESTFEMLLESAKEISERTQSDFCQPELDENLIYGQLTVEPDYIDEGSYVIYLHDDAYHEPEDYLAEADITVNLDHYDLLKERHPDFEKYSNVFSEAIGQVLENDLVKELVALKFRELLKEASEQ